MRSILLTLSLSLTVSINASAQIKTEDEYRQHSKEVAAEIWDNSDPAFSVKAVPEEFANESAVVIAKKFTLLNTAEKKRRRNRVTFDNTAHIRVKINDKVALSDYSSIEYEKQLVKNSRLVFSKIYNQRFTFVGAKVIKPDGREIIVNGDEEVLTTDEKKKKEGKLAISDLQVGDILDYYIKEEILTDIGTGIQGPFIFYLESDYPTMSLKVHMELDDQAGAMYVCANGAPKPKFSETDDGMMVDLDLKNLPKTGDMNWTSAMRQVPYVGIEYKVLANRAEDENSDFDKGVAKRAGDWETLFKNIKNGFTYSINSAVYSQPFTGVYFDWIEHHFGGKKKALDARQDSVVQVLYNSWLNVAVLNALSKSKFEIRDFRDEFEELSYFDFCKILDRLKIPHEIYFVPTRWGPTMDNFLLGGSSLTAVVHAKPYEGNDMWLNFERINFFSNKVPSWIEGEKGKGFIVKKGWYEKETEMPVSKAEDNKIKDRLEVQFDAGSYQLLNVNRTTTVTGNYIEGYMRDLQTPEAYVENLYALLNKTGRLEPDLRDFKVKKDVIASVKAGFSKAAETQKDDFTSDIKEWFEKEPKELLEYKVVGQTSDSFSFHSKFSMDNWVKKAGNNFLVEAGHLIGNFEKPDEKKRARKLDVFMSFPRTFDIEFSLNIPEGYIVKGTESFSKNIRNETGEFISSAEVQGNIIIFKVSRKYLHNYEKLDVWPKMLEIMDACYDFTQQKILFEKKK